MVKLYTEHKDEGLQFVSLTVDEEEDHDKAVKFLADQQADFPNLRYKAKDPEAWDIELGIEEGIPAAFLYDKEGNLVETFIGSGEETKAAMKKKVEELLK